MGKGRRPCCDKAGVKKGPWSQAEDLKLISFIQKHGHNNWRALPKLAGLARCGKSCRLRWVNYLRPDLRRGNFTPEEEETIIKLHMELGNKWSKIASHFPGRTDNEIKNVWNTHLKKRLKARGCQDKKGESSSCNKLSNQQVLTHQTVTSNNDTLESSSSSSSSYVSQASFSDYHMIDDLNPNMVQNVGDDHKEETSACMDYYKNSSEDPLNELIEIPFEPNLDLWDLLNGEKEVQFNDVDTPISENDKKNNENIIMQDGGSWWWLVYLENELGLDHQYESTPLLSTNGTSPSDLFSDISI